MRLYRYGITPQLNNIGVIVGGTLWVENRDDMKGNNLNATFYVDAETYDDVQGSDVAIQNLAETMLSEILGLTIEADTQLAISLLNQKIADKDAVIVGLQNELAAKTEELTAAIMEMMMIMAGAQEVGSPIPEVPTEPIHEPEIPEMPQEPEVPAEPIPDIPVEPTPEEPSPVEPEVPINEEPTKPMPEEPAPAEGTDSPTEPTPTETNSEDSTP